MTYTSKALHLLAIIIIPILEIKDTYQEPVALTKGQQS